MLKEKLRKVGLYFVTAFLKPFNTLIINHFSSVTLFVHKNLFILQAFAKYNFCFLI